MTMDVHVFDAQIVLLPEGEQQDELVRLSSAAAQRFPALFTLDDRHLPHLTLYQSVFPLAHKMQTYECLQSCAAHTKSFNVVLHDFSEFRGALFYDAEKDDSLMSLHQHIVTSLNPLREGLLTDECRKFLHDSSLSSKEQKNVMNYGNPFVLEQYRPHVTLTKLRDLHETGKALEYLAHHTQELSFHANALYLTAPGEHRTCTRILARFPFCG